MSSAPTRSRTGFPGKARKIGAITLVVNPACRGGPQSGLGAPRRRETTPHRHRWRGRRSHVSENPPSLNPRRAWHHKRTRESLRDQPGMTTLSELSRQLSPIVRKLLRALLFTITTAGTLALGIGTNVAIFTIVNGVLLNLCPTRTPTSS